jgi:predicted transposase YbfD/YdcC
MSTLTKTSKKLQLSEEFLESFSVIPDERINRQKLHSLKNIMIIAICGILCGADSWLAIEKIGNCKLKWFRKFLWLPHGIPSHDTFARVFVWLDPKALQSFLAKWAGEFCDLVEGETIAIDGKTQRRSFDRASEKSAIHVVTAFACESGLALGLTKVASKSNEIKAIPEILDMIDVNKCTVTIDAIGCQKIIAAKIREKGADYVLAVKRNQLNLYLQIKMLLDGFSRMHQLPDEVKFHLVESDGHGRHEIRRYWITDCIESIKGSDGWCDLKSVGCVESTRIINGKQSIETRYFIASVDADAQRFAKSVKNHWKIENSYHWTLDVIFRADDNRMRLGHSPENFSVLQAFALNLLKMETRSKNSVRIKRLMCANDEKYLQKVLFAHSKKFNA